MAPLDTVSSVDVHPDVHLAAPDTRHERADLLLVHLTACRSRSRRCEIESEVVALTADIAESAARRYRSRGLELDDLRQVALLALVKAVRGFRPDRGHCFAAYAVPTITGELKRHFRDTGWVVRPPRRLQEVRMKAATEQEHLRHTLQREPTPDELASALGLDRRDLDEGRQAAAGFRAHSLDGATNEGNPFEVAESGDAYADVDQRDALHRALATIEPRELEILRLRFVEDRTQTEIGRAIGVSQMQVSRLLSSTLATLRATLVEAADAVA
jgi:RNA polymerase sigma-B factor